jgi:hypothetical protein
MSFRYCKLEHLNRAWFEREKRLLHALFASLNPRADRPPFHCAARRAGTGRARIEQWRVAPFKPFLRGLVV